MNVKINKFQNCFQYCYKVYAAHENQLDELNGLPIGHAILSEKSSAGMVSHTWNSKRKAMVINNVLKQNKISVINKKNQQLLMPNPLSQTI